MQYQLYMSDVSNLCKFLQGVIMFYNYDLLCTRAGGKFALIWLAATNKKLSFNEIMKVNIHDSW